MRNFFYNMRLRFSNFMQGRYGFDALSKATLIAALVCYFLSAFPFLGFFYFLYILLIAITFIRCFSKNIGARSKELYKYYNIKNKFTGWFNLKKKIWNERKTHRYFKCTKCKAVLRVPKGKGKIEVKCRVCGEKSIRKS